MDGGGISGVNVSLDQDGAQAVFVSGCKDVGELNQELSLLASLVHLKPFTSPLAQVVDSLSGLSSQRWLQCARFWTGL